MKRLSSLLLVALLSVWLAGCGGDEKEKKFSQEVQTSLQSIQTRLDSAIQTKNSADSSLKALTTTSDQLRDEIQSLRASLNQLDSTLTELQGQVNALRTSQSEFEKLAQGGSFLKWLIFIIVILVIIYLVYKFIKQPKPFDEEEEEDFSAFDEDLGYEEEGGEELGPEEPKEK